VTEAFTDAAPRISFSSWDLDMSIDQLRHWEDAHGVVSRTAHADPQSRNGVAMRCVLVRSHADCSSS
jgi:hypothetical protein